MFSGIKLELVGNIFIFILIILAFIASTIFVYRKTNPPISTNLRRLLIALRIITLAIIIFILFEPLLSISYNRVQKPITAVLVDVSASMNLQDAKVQRSQDALRVLQQPLFHEKRKDLSFQFFEFSDHLRPIREADIDSLKFSRDGTDITSALQQLTEKMDEEYLAGVVLISDGNYTIGENPARFVEDYPVPIFPIAIGDPAEQKDIIISRVTTNQITYANTKVPVDVTVKATGYKGKKVTAILSKDGQQMDSKLVELTDHAMETKVRLHYTPQEAGNQKYTIRIPAAEDELTSLNNAKNFYTKVLKSKMKILVIAGGPSYDYKFLKRQLTADENIETTFWTGKLNDSFYEGAFPSSYEALKIHDAIILLDFPRKNTPATVLNIIKNLIDVGNKPLLIIHGKDLYYPALRSIQANLPVDLRLSTIPEQLVTFQITSQGMNHPLMRFTDNDIDNKNKWQELPPIYYSFWNVTLTPGSTSLLEVDRQQSGIRNSKAPLPLLAVRKLNQQKTIMLLGNGIWRWDFLMQGIDKTNEDYSRFIANCIRWLVTSEDSKLVRIFTDKDIYRSGERVSFSAETYYEDYRPLDGANVQVTVSSAGKTFDVPLAAIGEGKYEGEFQALEGGDYAYRGQAHFQDRLLGEASGRFSMEDFSLEFIDTKMNEPLLQQIADNSRGKYFTSETISGLTEQLHFPERKINESRQWEIWNKIFLLIAIILLLSIEWFIRKKKGML